MIIAMLAEKPEISIPNKLSYAELQILANSIFQLRLRKTALEKNAQADDRAEQWIAEIMEALHNDGLDNIQFYDTLARKLIESITVKPGEQVKIVLKMKRKFRCRGNGFGWGKKKIYNKNFYS